jgi:glutamyl/glutaminyl-tRNA synthetase
MKITHIIRGEDHISNTPKQILLIEALGFFQPKYAHLPLILDQDRSKLSKRRVETSLLQYDEKGYLPDSVVNFMALLGWHPKDDREVLTRNELVELFEIGRVQKSGAVFNQEKLDWLNAQHLKRLSVEELAQLINPFLEKNGIKTDPGYLKQVISVERDRIKTLADFVPSAEFFFKLPEYDSQLLVWTKDTPPKAKVILSEVLDVMKKLPPSDYNRDGISSALASLTEKEGRGSVFWPLRVAVSGRKASPDPIEIIQVLGPDETLRRIDIAIKKLSSHIL